jgi:hypothetical protein
MRPPQKTPRERGLAYWFFAESEAAERRKWIPAEGAAGCVLETGEASVRGPGWPDEILIARSGRRRWFGRVWRGAGCDGELRGERASVSGRSRELGQALATRLVLLTLCPLDSGARNSHGFALCLGNANCFVERDRATCTGRMDRRQSGSRLCVGDRRQP